MRLSTARLVILPLASVALTACGAAGPTKSVTKAIDLDNAEASVTAGEGTLVLGALNLQRVQVDPGAGEFTLDLRGTPRRSYDVKVNAGVGGVTAPDPDRQA